MLWTATIPVFRVSNKVKLEPVCSAIENIRKMETLHVKGVKKVRSEIKLCSCQFSNNVLEYTHDTDFL